MRASRSSSCRSWRAASALVASLGAALLCGPAPAGALPLIGHNGRWLTDPQGRVVVLHGLQIDKFRPTEPVEYIDLAPANVRFMAAEGFNLARVSIAYAGVEATKGIFDESYLESYVAFDRQLAGAGVYDLLDMMQGQFSADLGGWGFPNWMTLTDGLPNGRQPFPQGYFANPAEERAWDNLWSNAAASDGVRLQDHYASGLRHIAGRFANAPGLLGVEILNEPWAGSQYPTCANPAGCPPGGFDQTSLTDFYRREVPAVRAADPTHLILYEPSLLFDQGAASGLGVPPDPNVAFAFHNYCIGDTPGLPQGDPGNSCGANEQMTFANAETYQQRSGAGLLMDEWGNSTDTNLINRMTQEADQHMVGWADWALEDCCNSPAAVISDGTRPPDAPGNLNAAVLGALVRAYPRVIAGTPTSWSYDPSSRSFALDYTTKLVGGGRAAGLETDVFVPQLHYPGGYRVHVSGASVISSPTAGLLRLCNAPGAATVSVRVGPDSGGSTGVPGDPSASATSCATANAADTGGLATTVSHGGANLAIAGIGKIHLPRLDRCVSRRRFKLRISLQRGIRVVSASATVGRRRVAFRFGRSLNATVDLRGLPRGRFRMRLELRVIKDGRPRTVRLTRVYHTCVARRRHPRRHRKKASG